MDSILYALRKVSLRGSIRPSLYRVKNDRGMSIFLWSWCRSCRLKIWLRFFSTKKREEAAVTGQTSLSAMGPRRKTLTKRRSLCCRWGKMASSSNSALFSSVVSRPVRSLISSSWDTVKTPTLNIFLFLVTTAKLIGELHNNQRSATNSCPRSAYSFVSFLLRQYYQPCDSYSAYRWGAVNKKKSVKTSSWRYKFNPLCL